MLKELCNISDTKLRVDEVKCLPDGIILEGDVVLIDIGKKYSMEEIKNMGNYLDIKQEVILGELNKDFNKNTNEERNENSCFGEKIVKRMYVLNLVIARRLIVWKKCRIKRDGK